MTPVGAVVDLVPNLRALRAELDTDGIDPSSDLGRRSIEIWLGTQTGERCSKWVTDPSGRRVPCGNPLARYERINGKCQRCSHIELHRFEAERLERQRYAR